MGDYEYKDYDTLLSSISNGDYVINRPLNVNGEKVSFLNKLLDYSNVDKDNLHKIFLDIINRIKHT